jgi:redoxin
VAHHTIAAAAHFMMLSRCTGLTEKAVTCRPRKVSFPMNMRCLLTVNAVVMLTMALGLSAAAAAERLELADVLGEKHQPLADKGQKATVFFFIGHDCPISNSYAPEINRICAEYEVKKFSCYLVYPDPDLSAADAKKHTKEFSYHSPALLDPSHKLVKKTGVTVTPEVAVLAPIGKLLYRGRIDNIFADFGKKRSEPTQRDLRLALNAISKDKPVPNKTTKAIGCYIPTKTSRRK